MSKGKKRKALLNKAGRRAQVEISDLKRAAREIDEWHAKAVRCFSEGLKYGIQAGRLLIAARAHQLEPWAEMPGDSSIPAPSLHKPVSWVVPATEDAPYWLTGGRNTIAVRLTDFPVAAKLCDAVDSALISTSANVSGCPPARNAYVLRRQFSSLVDYIVPGRCGPVKGPSEIRDLQSGETLRPASI